MIETAAQSGTLVPRETIEDIVQREFRHLPMAVLLDIKRAYEMGQRAGNPRGQLRDKYSADMMAERAMEMQRQQRDEIDSENKRLREALRHYEKCVSAGGIYYAREALANTQVSHEPAENSMETTTKTTTENALENQIRECSRLHVAIGIYRAALDDIAELSETCSVYSYSDFGDVARQALQVGAKSQAAPG